MIEVRAFAGPAGELVVAVEQASDLPAATMGVATSVVQSIFDRLHHERKHPTITSLEQLRNYCVPISAAFAGLDELFHQGAAIWREESRRLAQGFLTDGRQTMLAWRAQVRQELYAVAHEMLGRASARDARKILLAAFPDAYPRQGLRFLRF